MCHPMTRRRRSRSHGWEDLLHGFPSLRSRGHEGRPSAVVKLSFPTCMQSLHPFLAFLA